MLPKVIKHLMTMGKKTPTPKVLTAQIPRCEQLEDRILLSLLGIAGQIELPATSYDATGAVTYDAPSEAFDVSALPISIAGLGPIPFVFPPNDFQLHIQVDNAGNLVSGVAGDDLFISGQIDADGNPGNGFEYSGVLLTGEILEFGYLDSGATDQYDFRLSPTGGALMSFFEGKDIGMAMTSINSTFVDFTTDFSGMASGTVGPLEPVAPPPVSSLSGFVYEDANNNGEVDANEYAIQGVTVTLSYVNDAGETVSIDQLTDADGSYMFVDLEAGNYTITETQPAGYGDGIETLGDGNVGGTVGNDVFSNIDLAAGVDGLNYNFGEQANTLAEGQTATIGFWQNKNGQNLIKSLNGDENSTALGEWLVATFPNIYGSESVRNDLEAAGLSNTSIATHYRNMFKTKAKELRQLGITNAPKLECQVMATALAVYVTSSNLAGNTAADYGFLVTANGVGAGLFNVGSYGSELFGVEDGSEMLIMDILLSTDSQVVDGNLYDLSDIMRSMANEVYTAINEGGDIA